MSAPNKNYDPKATASLAPDEVARVLRPGGDFVVLNFSYRDDIELDRRDIAALAQQHAFDARENGAAPFSLWNARAFWLVRHPS